MKVRVNLKSGANKWVMAEITADGTATANDVAVAIASAGREELLGPQSPPLTLRVFGDYEATRTLPPEVPLAESGVSSGSSVEVVAEERAPVGQQPAALLRVVSGPDAGIEVPLPLGGSTIGRSSENDVRLSDARVSKRHARLLIGQEIEILDANSANGVLVAGEKVARAVLRSGDAVTLGDTVFRVQTVGGQELPAFRSEVPHLRPPVVLSRPKENEIPVPDVPGAPQKMAFPWLAMIVPLLMGGVMYLTTKSPMTMIFVAMSPLLMLGTYIGNKIDSKRKHKEELANFEEGFKYLVEEITSLQNNEREQLNEQFPSVSQTVSSVVNRAPQLWSRRPEHPEFLQVRLGTGTVVSHHQIAAASRSGMASLVKRLNELRQRHRYLPQSPITANLRSVGGVGLAGSAKIVGISRGLVLQVAGVHSPAEVMIACATSSTMRPEWAWLEWLPHCASPHSPISGPLLASDGPSVRGLLDKLDELIEERADNKAASLRGPLEDNEKPNVPVTPSVLLVVHDAPVDLPRVANIAERGPDVGVHVLWVAESSDLLPSACRTFLDLGQNDNATVGMVRSEMTVPDVITESVDLETATTAARALAPVVDASAPISDETDLPRMVSVINLFGQQTSVDPQQILTRWQENGSYIDRNSPPTPKERAGDLRALVGHAGMEPFTLDLRSQGPHALVGGTTGAGKSEFLQAWVLGMAHAYSPDKVTFLFVDYKGGAAFAKCIDLPHSVGLVTDLSPYLVRRALRSLRAEIHRREHLFNAKGVKDLIDFEKTGDPECPPSLIIIVDEFAALVGEVPEFVDGVVDIAQRGRSLGLHLVLATQRPAGVIKDNLRANTNLRIALRMNDAHDSSDVLGSNEAAHIDPANPGRGVARVGPSRLIPFQSAFPGARTPDIPPTPPIEVVQLNFGKGSEWKIPRPKAVGKVVDKDINRVVDAVAQASALGRVPRPRRPWLDTLSKAYDLKKLNQRSDYDIVLGLVDDPDTQSQHVEYFHPDEKGNIVYFGAGGSGKTTALRSLAIAASITPRSGPVHIYGLDFAGGGLAMLEPLVNVGAIISGDDDERVARLITMLIRLLDERSVRYSGAHADTLRAFRNQAGAADEPRILVLLDGFSTFRGEYDSGLQRLAVWEQFQRLANEGRAVGIHFAVTADRLLAIPPAIQGSFQQRMVLRMPNEDAYLSIGVPRDILDPSSPPGRCLNVDFPNELQLAVLGRDPSPAGQSREIETMAKSMAKFHTSRPEPVRRLSAEIQSSSLPPRVNGLPTLGVADTTLAPIGFEPQGTFLVSGQPGADTGLVVGWIAESFKRAMPDVPRVLLSARSTELAKSSVWLAAVSGTERVAEFVESQLAPLVGTETESGKPKVAIFVEQYPEFAGSSVESALGDLVKQSRRNGHFFLGVGEAQSFSGFSSLFSELKAGRAGFLLQPEQSDGDLLRATLPRGRAIDYPPGRGFFVQHGRTHKVQLPVME